jgi:hypothetical protein
MPPGLLEKLKSQIHAQMQVRAFANSMFFSYRHYVTREVAYWTPFHLAV